MRVLVACEFSGVVRRAFRALGHEAWSCDLLPAEDGSEFHLQGDLQKIRQGGFPLLEWRWDMLIAHPPCTFLCNSGVRWLYKDEPEYVNLAGRTSRYYRRVKDENRWIEMAKACDLFAFLWNAPIPRKAIENPVMHRHAKEYLGNLGVPPFAHSIQPWQFGHGEIKRTCLWLQNLEPLKPTQIVEGRKPRVHHASPGADRWKERSRTLEGIARAMAEQWSI